jgi:hypothetical protein
MDVHFDVTGARQVGLRFDAFPDALYDDLKGEIDALSVELLARVQASTPVKTGALRASERMRLFADKNRITGYVDIAAGKGSQAFAKAGALEYGAHRATKVSAHSMKLDHAWGYKLAAPMDVLVAAYTRTPDIEEFAFERGPLAEMQPEVIARLEAVVAKATAVANA